MNPTEIITTAAPTVAAAVQNTEIATWFVVVMGLGIVFIGLICLIAIISLMGCIMKRVNARHAETEAAAPAPVATAEIPNRSELVAAVSAALAEELGKDVRAIRILSIKRV